MYVNICFSFNNLDPTILWFNIIVIKEFMEKKGRRPSDYPQFAFRLSAEEKERLSKMIDEVTDLYNKQVSAGEYLYRKNDIIIEALEKGLKAMKSNHSKK